MGRSGAGCNAWEGLRQADGASPVSAGASPEALLKAEFPGAVGAGGRSVRAWQVATRHEPEKTVLYEVVHGWLETFLAYARET